MVVFISSCQRVTIEIESIPDNTPAGSSIFVSGNFNLWDAGDGTFRMQKAKSGKFYLDLPMGWGLIEYKFTRGDWTAVEGDACGNAISNRAEHVGSYWMGFLRADTIKNKIYSWEDLGATRCERITFRIKKLPRETPKNDKIFIFGSFNDWKQDDEKYVFEASKKDNYLYYTLPKSDSEIEFKISRGRWDTEEVDINGDRISNRKFVFGKQDTVDMDVAGWMDINPGLEARDVTFLVSIPSGTPPGDPIYIVGTFNKWFPGDPRYRLKKLGPNLFSIKMKKPAGEMEYKFVRGPWGTEEMDVFGNHISNRKLRTSADTVKTDIPEWLDIPIDQTFSLNRQEIDYIMKNPDVCSLPALDEETTVKFSLVPNIAKPTFFYIRVGLPSSPNNRNYGLVDLVKPGSKLKIICPVGSIFYACDGPFWNDNRPKEKKAFVVTTEYEGKTIDLNLLLPPK